MPTALIRSDERGLYFIADGQRYRPGPLYLPRPMRHDEGGLAKGDRTGFRRVPSAPAAILQAKDGGETVWETEDCKDSLDRRNQALADPALVERGRRIVEELLSPVDVHQMG